MKESQAKEHLLEFARTEARIKPILLDVVEGTQKICPHTLDRRRLEVVSQWQQRLTEKRSAACIVFTPSRTCARPLEVDNRESNSATYFRSMFGRIIRIGGAAAAQIRSAPSPFSDTTCMYFSQKHSVACCDIAAATTQRRGNT